MQQNQNSTLARVWAPALAAVIVAVFYLPRLDDVFYFLHGLESQGTMLASALAGGHGFVDLSLAGHPAHVREPPLFYLCMAAIIRLFGLTMLPQKIFIWASYTASAGLAAILFQRRSSPLIALSASILALTTPDMFRFLTGPKSDLPFTAVLLAAVIAFELTHDAIARRHDNSNTIPGRSPVPAAIVTGILIAAAVMMRSLGLALVLGAGAGLVFARRKIVPLKSRLFFAAVVALPTVIAFGAWTVRNSTVPNPGGYTYADWFLMDLPPDSPQMTAIDFHAPLAGPVPRVSAAGFIRRVLHHARLYGALLGGSIHALEWWNASGPRQAILILICIAGLASMLTIELRPGRFMVPVMAASYGAVLLVWPMDDPRLLMPLAPFAAFYPLAGLDLVIKKYSGARSRIITPLTIALIVMIFNLHYALGYQSAVSQLPTETFRPGFTVRFTSREAWESYHLLRWAARNTDPGAVLMYHSTPPCRVFSGHVCSPIPATEDLARARDYIVNGGADYLIVDEWGRAFPGGSGWFTEHVLRPVAKKYPGDFQEVFRIPGSEAIILKVKK